MRYFYISATDQMADKWHNLHRPIYVYKCNHPVCDSGTVYFVPNRGIMVIQQHYDPETKHTWWGPIPSNIANDIYMNPGFNKFFDKWATAASGIYSLYPTFTVRQVMWALRMKPLQRKDWETDFPRKPI